MARITQWQNLKFIYEEFLNKTSLALMVCKRHFLNIFFIYYQVVYLCCILLRCVTAYLFLFLLMTWPEYLFLKKSSPKRYAGPLPLFELGNRPVKTNINRIFPCHFFLTMFCNFP
jgi:hypothetical protein